MPTVPVLKTRLKGKPLPAIVTQEDRLSGPAEAYYKVLKPKLARSATEELWALYMDGDQRPIGMHLIARGNLNAVGTEPRAVFIPALLANAEKMVLAHNHPAGPIQPSDQDISMTAHLWQAGNLLGIRIMDHLVMSPAGYTSLSREGLMPDQGNSKAEGEPLALPKNLSDALIKALGLPANGEIRVTGVDGPQGPIPVPAAAKDTPPERGE